VVTRVVGPPQPAAPAAELAGARGESCSSPAGCNGLDADLVLAGKLRSLRPAGRACSSPARGSGERRRSMAPGWEDSQSVAHPYVYIILDMSIRVHLIHRHQSLLWVSKGFITTQLGVYRLQENYSLCTQIILSMFISSYVSRRDQSRLGVSKGFLFKKYHNDVTKSYLYVH
jgi:hypothetical protein